MNDIAFKVIIKNDGIDDVIFKTLMLKGEKGDKGDAGGAEIDDSTTASNTTWSSDKIRAEIDEKPDNLSELDDVDLDSITDEQLLGYNFTTGKWKNKSVDASTLKYDANTTIKSKIDEKANTADLATVATSGEYNDLSNKPQLATVATSGDYDDLSNKPTIPSAQVNSDWNATSGVAEILNKPTIPVVDQTLNVSSSNAIANSAVANGLAGKVNTSDYTADILPITSGGVSTKSYIDSIGITHSLFLPASISTTSTNYNTFNNRKFSDYDYLIFKMGASAYDTRNTVILPITEWVSGRAVNIGALHGASSSSPTAYNYSSLNITYNSDTSFTAIASGSATLNNLVIYGLKVKA